MILAALLLLLFVLLACTPVLPPEGVARSSAPRPTIEICIDQDFTDDVAFEAVEAWDVELRGVVSLRARTAEYLELGRCDVGIYRLDSTEPWVAMQPSWDLAYTTSNRRSIFIVADRRPDLRRLVIEHELGHAFGLDHSLTGIMRPEHSHTGPKVSTTDAIWAAYYLGGRE